MDNEIGRLMAKQESVRGSRPRLFLWLCFMLMAGMLGLTIGEQVAGITGAWAAVAVCNALVLYAMARQDKACLELAERIAALEKRLGDEREGTT